MEKSTSSFYIHHGWLKLLEKTAQKYHLDIKSYTEGFSRKDMLDIRNIRKVHHQMMLDSKDVAFSIYAAQMANPLSLGSYSLTLWTSPDLQTLLENAQRYCVAVASPIRLHLNYTAHGDAELWVINHEPLNEESRVTYVGVTLYFATLIHLIHETTEYKVKEMTVKLNAWPYDEDERTRFSTLIGCKIATGSAVRKLCIPRKYLTKALATHDADIYANAKELLRQQAAKVESEDVVLQVYKALDSQPLTQPVSVEAVAKWLCVSVRTLNRRLTALGTSYRNILEKYKLEKAFHLLSSSDNSIGEIGYQLGFSDSSTFSRAFKKWTGFTPSYVAAQRENAE